MATTSTTQADTTLQNKNLVILIGSEGGLSDVGRHVVQATLDISNTTCTVLMEDPKQLLEESNWNCGCPEPHELFKNDDQKNKRMKIVQVKSWYNDNDDNDDISQYFENAAAVIMCVGNRQPFIGHWDAHAASLKVLRAVAAKDKKVNHRVVALSSVGIEDDWPPVEWHWAGNILRFLFLTLSRKSFQDLTLMEREIRSSSDTVDYLLVRPVGIGEDVIPCGKWIIQKEKYDKDDNKSIYFNMAKLDVARYMVQEALQPTRHRDAVVIGAELPQQK